MTGSVQKKKKRRKRCQMCGVLNYEVKILTDPWLEDVEGIKEKMRLCPDCYEARLADI